MKSRTLLAVTMSGLMLLAPLLALASGPRRQTDSGADLADKLKTIEEQIEAARKEAGVPGLSVAIVKDDKLIFAKGFGMRDQERGLPVTEHTLFAIGSASKAFTSMAAAISVDQGKLSWDDSPHKYLPYFRINDPDTDSKIQLRDMLSHHTGLAAYTDLPWFAGTLNRVEVIKVIGNAKPVAPIRTKFFYNNVMFSAAGEVVATVQKQSYEDCIENMIFKPLGMNSSDLFVKVMQKSPDFSRGYHYDKEEKKAILVKTRDITNISPAGAINSNVIDMSHWVRLMLGRGEFEGKRLVSEKNFNEMVSPQNPLGPGVAYGFGWVLASWHNHKTIWHNGGIDGFHSLVEMMPEQNLGFVILSNTDGSPLESTFADIIFSNMVPGEKGTDEAKSAAGAATPVSEAEATELTGAYEKDSFDAKIANDGGKLTLAVPGQPTYPMVAKGKDEFGLAKMPDSFRILVKRDAAGKVSGIDIKQPQGVLALIRKADFKAPIEPSELIAKAIQATGGEEAIRREKSKVITGDLNIINQGLTGEITMSSRAPNSTENKIVLIGLGRKIGWIREYFNGSAGGQETSFTAPQPLSKSQVENTAVEHAFYPLLDSSTLFQDVKITGIQKVDGEDAYVTVMTAKNGASSTSYISTTSFLILRRDVSTPGEGGESEPVSEYYSDYKKVDGVMVPFKIVQKQANGDFIITVKDIKFNTSIPDAHFSAGN